MCSRCVQCPRVKLSSKQCDGSHVSHGSTKNGASSGRILNRACAHHSSTAPNWITGNGQRGFKCKDNPVHRWGKKTQPAHTDMFSGGGGAHAGHVVKPQAHRGGHASDRFPSSPAVLVENVDFLRLERQRGLQTHDPPTPVVGEWGGGSYDEWAELVEPHVTPHHTTPRALKLTGR